MHGHNNEIPDVMRGYWRVVTQMKDTGVTGAVGYGLVLGFTWPGFATKAGYFTAAVNANKTSAFLAELVNEVRAVATPWMSRLTHSLGARVALQALKNPKKTFIDNLLLSAPAVDNHVLEPEESFHSSIKPSASRGRATRPSRSNLRISLLSIVPRALRRTAAIRTPSSTSSTGSKC